MDERPPFAVPIGTGDNQDEVDQHPDAKPSAGEQLSDGDSGVPGVEPMNPEKTETPAKNQCNDERVPFWSVLRRNGNGRAAMDTNHGLGTEIASTMLTESHLNDSPLRGGGRDLKDDGQDD